MTPRHKRPQLDRLYHHYRDEKHPRNINTHMDYLCRLASTVRTVTELGVDTAFSSMAFLYGEPEKLTSIDVARKPEVDTLMAVLPKEGTTAWEFIEANINEVEIEPTDLLFIDADHRYDEVKIQLDRHGPKARKYIVLHDTVGFGEVEIGTGEEGIWRAVAEFCRENPEWIFLHHVESQYGLTVLARGTGFLPALPSPAQSPPRAASAAPRKPAKPAKAAAKNKLYRPKTLPTSAQM